jgi:hypothetical protein
MRARVICVAFVVFGLVGTVAVSASAADRARPADHATLTAAAEDSASSVGMVPMDRGHDHGDDHGHGVHGDRCVAEGDTLVGPVCVTVNDVLSDILTG